MSAGSPSPRADTAQAGSPVTPAPSLLLAVEAARDAIGPLPKDSTNPHFGSKFTSLGAGTTKVFPALRTQGLSWFTKPSMDVHGRPSLKYKLTHLPTGEVEADEMPLIGVEHMQGQGSALTYARRYTLFTVLGLVGDDDDDGNASVPQARREASQTGDTVNLIEQAKGLSNGALNVVLRNAGLQTSDRPFGYFARIPGEKAEQIRELLQGAHATEGR